MGVAMISDPTAMLAAPTSTGLLAPRRLGKHINSLAEVVVAPPLPMHVSRVVVPPAVERAPKEGIVAMISDPTAMLAARTSTGLLARRLVVRHTIPRADPWQIMSPSSKQYCIECELVAAQQSSIM